MPAADGYLEMIRAVCDEYDIILIFDEIMCGMGRTGHLHAWQESGVVPDIQLIGKALSGGFAPVSAMLVGPKIVDALLDGPSKGAFNHGHTFQNQPMSAGISMEVQAIVQDDRLLENVREKGPLLLKKLRARLGSHRYVGDIRGPKDGLFPGVSGEPSP
jgi:adenosylmethionine-8-amino-7-oxononanoate aminotransferase